MRKSLPLLTVLALVAGLTTSAFAERWGRPGAKLNKCQWSLGIEYNYIEAERDLRPPKGLFGMGEEQFILHQILVTVSHGLTDDLEAFIKMGGTSTDITDAFLTGSEKYPDELRYNQDFNSNLEFTIVGGLAATIFQSGNLTVGALGQLSWRSLNDDAPADDFYQFIDAYVFTAEGALVASYRMDKMLPYAGVCMVISDADFRYRAVDPVGYPLGIFDIDVEQEDWFGMIVGVNFEVMENVFLGVEMTHVSEGVGLSTGVTCAF